MDGEASSKDSACDFCGEQADDGREWVLLNRWGVCDGSHSSYVHVENDDGEYVWDIGDDDEPAKATGRLLCFPRCLGMWIQGQMAELEPLVRGGG